MPDPVLHLLVGPNGSGRSTLHERVVGPATGLGFINADLIAEPERVSRAAEAGFIVTLHVLLVPQDLAVARVATRVATGGHPVPEEKIRARHQRLWDHVAAAVGSANEAYFYDNSRADHPFRLVATFLHGHPEQTPRWPDWTPPQLLNALP